MCSLRLLALLVATGYCEARFGDLLVQTDTGLLSGWERLSRDGRIYQAWTGIPYAEPPVGTLRFKAPRSKSPWKRVLEATQDPPACLQHASDSKSLKGSEDCLFLNVYRPKIEKDNMPVLVHVHGGAFQGGNMGPHGNADYLMDEDVVLVAIQYRLNAFGFMSLGDAVMPGNFGLKDQVLALKWVKRNIAKFGGNPDSVTVFGESAGGASTHILLKSPATDGLVQRALSDSGTVNKFWSMLNPRTIKQHTTLVARRCGCLNTDSQSLLHCLQRVDASTIITQTLANGIDPTVQLFVPVIEPAEAEDPIATFDLSLRPSKKPWITSVCPGEWLLFRMMMGERKFDQDMRKYLIEYLPLLPIGLTETQVRGAAEIFERVYFPPNVSSADRSDQIAKFGADFSFLYPVIANIMLHEGPKWIYRYEYVDEVSRYHYNLTEEVAPHASQIHNYLNMRETIPTGSNLEKQEDYDVSRRLIKYLVNFAYHDDPTPADSPFQWKQFNETEVLRITKFGDFYADRKILQEMIDVYSLWDTVIGWRNHI